MEDIGDITDVSNSLPVCIYIILFYWVYTVELYTVIYYHDIPILVSGSLGNFKLALAGQKDQLAI